MLIFQFQVPGVFFIGFFEFFQGLQLVSHASNETFGPNTSYTSISCSFTVLWSGSDLMCSRTALQRSCTDDPSPHPRPRNSKDPEMFSNNRYFNRCLNGSLRRVMAPTNSAPATVNGEIKLTTLDDEVCARYFAQGISRVNQRS